MYMDLTDMISGGMEEQQIPEQKLTKEEYAAKKQQEREEVWAEVDSQAQGVFQDGEKLKGFLDFMAECNTQRTPNLLLIYGQHPDFKVVRSYERWREEHNCSPDLRRRYIVCNLNIFRLYCSCHFESSEIVFAVSNDEISIFIDIGVC